MSSLFIATIVSLVAVSIAMAVEFEKLREEEPQGTKEWSIGLMDAWTKAQISYLKNLHWILLAMITAGIAWSLFGPKQPLPYPFDQAS